jgi:hypothetical protein
VTQVDLASIKPTPTDEEVAAIIAAIEATAPRPVIVQAAPSGPPPWRFSSRWWRKPIPARRERPW